MWTIYIKIGLLACSFVKYYFSPFFAQKLTFSEGFNQSQCLFRRRYCLKDNVGGKKKKKTTYPPNGLTLFSARLWAAFKDKRLQSSTTDSGFCGGFSNQLVGVWARVNVEILRSIF